MKKDLYQQLEEFNANFPSIPPSVELTNEKMVLKENCISLLVFPENMIETKSIFERVDLGCMGKNTWFLDKVHMYDIVENIPRTPYVVHNINVTFNTLGTPWYTRYYFGEQRPLTFHEVVTLAFYFPDIFNEKISGIQAYGSRFANSKGKSRNADTDDTLEIYRKGDPGEGFLKLAREFHRYHEKTKIIPFALEN